MDACNTYIPSFRLYIHKFIKEFLKSSKINPEILHGFKFSVHHSTNDRRRRFHEAADSLIKSIQEDTIPADVPVEFWFESIRSDGVVHGVTGGSSVGIAAASATSVVAPLRPGVDYVCTCVFGFCTIETTSGCSCMFRLKLTKQ
ncbi:hypothetical protein L1987_21489 [Smallanthus sonchifolius]|uniref:Uncharacterized protein n=1 Tax=Smallanthus sonchifolius TaxID=185202 RepID=A0ACB9IV16_9ASTR|nr:hypothetical protein L1987_21489 [Smallanthus sonchifolius]